MSLSSTKFSTTPPVLGLHVEDLADADVDAVGLGQRLVQGDGVACLRPAAAEAAAEVAPPMVVMFMFSSDHGSRTAHARR
jgi:hypothetical protein